MRWLGVLVWLCSLQAHSFEVPARLAALLKGSNEQTYLGQTHQQEPCEIKVYLKPYGFFIEAYERDESGGINPNQNFGRFELSDSYEIFDYWDDNFSTKIVSALFSPAGGSFDRRTILEIKYLDEKERKVDIAFKKSNGFFLYTFYRFECFMEL